MKISIVIPTYNSEKYLDQCLQSIFNQSYKNFEVIVVDGYSTDKTQDILSRYRLRTILRKPKGEPDAINLGMSLAAGDIVTYIDADDTYNKDCFAIVAKVFENPYIRWLYSSGKIIDSNGNECRNIITTIKKLFWNRYNYNTYILFNYIVQPTVFLRKSFYNKIGEFDTTLKYVFDYDYFIRAGKLSTPTFINYPLANWRSHSNSITAQAPKETAKQALEIQKKYSGKTFRPIQYLLYIANTLLYRSLG
jgi:glycosyltransferase involved in cell wall biosynthesis